MKDAIPRLFADITAKLEDTHMIALEGQRRDNTPDMQRVLASQLRMGVASLDTSLAKIERRLGDDHD
ncbi:MAG: hypothetical protein R3E02_11995 [Blastomonas sp.]